MSLRGSVSDDVDLSSGRSEESRQLRGARKLLIGRGRVIHEVQFSAIPSPVHGQLHTLQELCWCAGDTVFPELVETQPTFELA